MTAAAYALPPDASADIAYYEQELARWQGALISGEEFRHCRVVRGVYEQRQDNTFMTRVRLAAGYLGPAQARLLAELSRTYANGLLHVTTRQDIQLHDVAIADTPKLMRALQPVGLSTKGGGGNTVRNVTACPYAGVCAQERFDVTGFAAAVTTALLAVPASFTLPRKYKVAFSGCANDCALATVADVGFVATVQGDQAGFQVFAGGGLGAKPRLADLILAFLPAAEAALAAEAGRRLFDRIGDRQHRNRARLRFAAERLGAPAFRTAFLDELDAVRQGQGVALLTDLAAQANQQVRQTSAAPVPAAPNVAFRTVAQAQPDLVALPLYLPLGKVTAAELVVLADLAEQFSQEQALRTTKDQNLVIRAVPRHRLEALADQLRQHNPAWLEAHALSGIVPCTGAATCRLGLCQSPNLAAAAGAALDEAGLAMVAIEVGIRISGCPNSCAQQQISAIGLFGIMRQHDGRAYPAYRLLVGGQSGVQRSRFGEIVATIPARNVPAALVALLHDYQQNRQPNETYPAYVDRQTWVAISLLLAEFVQVPEFSQAPQFYRDWEPSLSGNAADSRQVAPAATLDLQGVKCPINYVKAKIALEQLAVDAVLTVLVDAGEAVERVPNSFRADGFADVQVEQLSEQCWRIQVRNRTS